MPGQNKTDSLNIVTIRHLGLNFSYLQTLMTDSFSKSSHCVSRNRQHVLLINFKNSKIPLNFNREISLRKRLNPIKSLWGSTCRLMLQKHAQVTHFKLSLTHTVHANLNIHRTIDRSCSLSNCCHQSKVRNKTNKFNKINLWPWAKTPELTSSFFVLFKQVLCTEGPTTF